MKKILLASIAVLSLLIISNTHSFAQKVFKTKYSSQADLTVYIVDYESQCDLKVYFVDYESQADEDGKSQGGEEVLPHFQHLHARPANVADTRFCQQRQLHGLL